MKYKSVDELKIGIEVTTEELEDILDTYIILENSHLVPRSETFGTTYKGKIKQISKNMLHPSKNGDVLVFNDSIEKDIYHCNEY